MCSRDGGGSSSHSSNSHEAYTEEALDAEERTALMGWYRAIQIEDEELWCSDLVDISKGRWLRGHAMSAAFHLLQREVSLLLTSNAQACSFSGIHMAAIVSFSVEL
jgi:hypothetical protein